MQLNARFSLDDPLTQPEDRFSLDDTFLEG